jgi:hypothetical protein
MAKVPHININHAASGVLAGARLKKRNAPRVAEAKQAYWVDRHRPALTSIVTTEARTKPKKKLKRRA